MRRLTLLSMVALLLIAAAMTKAQDSGLRDSLKCYAVGVPAPYPDSFAVLVNMYCDDTVMSITTSIDFGTESIELSSWRPGTLLENEPLMPFSLVVTSYSQEHRFALSWFSFADGIVAESGGGGNLAVLYFKLLPDQRCPEGQQFDTCYISPFGGTEFRRRNGDPYSPEYSSYPIRCMASSEESEVEIHEDLPRLDITPNPFNNEASIHIALEKPRRVKIEILDILGRRIKTLTGNSERVSEITIPWNGTDNLGHQVPTGIYFARASAEDIVITKKLVLLK